MTALAHSTSRSVTRQAAGALALFAALLWSRPGYAEEPVPDYGKGMIELRLQTASNATSGALVASESTNGAYYSSVAQGVVLQAVVGGGYFLSPVFELGVDFSELYFLADSATPAGPNVLGLAPFVRVVSGVKSWDPGVFAEASTGLFGTRNGDQGQALLDFSLWAGGHFPLDAPLAFVVGPILSGVEDVKSGTGSFILGLRFGMSLYFPRDKPAVAKP